MNDVPAKSDRYAWNVVARLLRRNGAVDAAGVGNMLAAGKRFSDRVRFKGFRCVRRNEDGGKCKVGHNKSQKASLSIVSSKALTWYK